MHWPSRSAMLALPYTCIFSSRAGPAGACQPGIVSCFQHCCAATIQPSGEELSQSLDTSFDLLGGHRAEWQADKAFASGRYAIIGIGEKGLPGGQDEVMRPGPGNQVGGIGRW